VGLKDGPGELLSCTADEKSLKIFILHKGIAAPHGMLQTLLYDFRASGWRNKLQPLDSGNNYIKIANAEKLRFLGTALLLRRDIPFKLSINNVNGGIVISLLNILPAVAPSLEGKAQELALHLTRTVVLTFELFKRSASHYSVLWEFFEHCNRRVSGSRPRPISKDLKRCMGQFGVKMWFGGEA
jgi:hypothetical protein